MARVLLALAAAAVLAPAAPASASDIIVRREPGLAASQRADVRADAGARLVDRLSLPNTEVVSVPADHVSDALSALQADPRVRYAERDGHVHATGVADPLAPSQRDLVTVGAAGAWALSTGAGVTVAVVDTGIDAAHEDLAGQIAPGGFDWVDNDSTPNDLNGHGTHVSGTIAAIHDNGLGVAGLAPDARIMPLRVLDADGGGFESDVASAFDYAGSHGVRVVNASLGGPDNSKLVEDAIKAHPNTLYVVAAGNEGLNTDTTADYPCALPEANIICVGASTGDDKPAIFSNFGASTVDVFAPGTLILSTCFASTSSYCTMTGTSMATPHVAAVAALLTASAPAASAAQIKQAILGGALQLDAFKGFDVSGGRLDALGALKALQPAAPAPAPAPSTTTAPAATPAPAVAPAPQPAVVGQPAVAPAATAVAARVSRLRAVHRGRRTVVTFTLSSAAPVRAALRGQGTQTFMTIAGVSGGNRVTLPRRPRGRYTLRLVPINGGRRGKAVSLRLTLR
jgi:subtilisin family serine protease